MKNQFCLFIFIWIMIFWAACSLLSCTEYEILNTTDTVYLEKPVQSLAPSFVTVRDTVYIHTVDTIKVEVIIHDTIVNNIHTTDTLVQVVTKDSIIVKEVEKMVTVYQTVIEKDTIVVSDTVEIEVIQIEQRVIYLDTAYVMIYTRSTTYIPPGIQPHVDEFFGRATNVVGGHMIIQYTDDLPGEGWNSFSYWVGGPASSDNPYAQMVIEISSALPPELHRASILRELARLQLKKKYVTDVNKIMSPLFDPYRAITQNDLDILFNPLPI